MSSLKYLFFAVKKSKFDVNFVIFLFRVTPNTTSSISVASAGRGGCRIRRLWVPPCYAYSIHVSSYKDRLGIIRGVSGIFLEHGCTIIFKINVWFDYIKFMVITSSRANYINIIFTRNIINFTIVLDEF